MRKLKKIADAAGIMALWFLFSVFLWGFIFTRITDTAREYKLTICVDAAVPGAAELAGALEEGAGDKIRMVKVRPFSYAMFDGSVLEQADLLFIRASHMEAYGGWLRPLPEDMLSLGAVYAPEGVPLGLLAYDAEQGWGVAQPLIQYREAGETDENLYLCFGGQSLHAEGNEGAVDNEALKAAKTLMQMR